jgi:hypothetical protein
VTTEPKAPRKRRSRVLEVLEAQNAAEKDDNDVTEDELGLIAGLIQRIGHLPKQP